jgi:hypothetical protein
MPSGSSRSLQLCALWEGKACAGPRLLLKAIRHSVHRPAPPSAWPPPQGPGRTGAPGRPRGPCHPVPGTPSGPPRPAGGGVRRSPWGGRRAARAAGVWGRPRPAVAGPGGQRRPQRALPPGSGGRQPRRHPPRPGGRRWRLPGGPPRPRGPPGPPQASARQPGPHPVRGPRDAIVGACAGALWGQPTRTTRGPRPPRWLRLGKTRPRGPSLAHPHPRAPRWASPGGPRGRLPRRPHAGRCPGLGPRPGCARALSALGEGGGRACAAAPPLGECLPDQRGPRRGQRGLGGRGRRDRAGGAGAAAEPKGDRSRTAGEADAILAADGGPPRPYNQRASLKAYAGRP